VSLSIFVVWNCLRRISVRKTAIKFVVSLLSTATTITAYRLNTCHGRFCPHVFQIINHPNMIYYITYPVEKVILNKPRLSSDWRLVCISHRTCKSVNLFSTQHKDYLVCSSLSNSLFNINNSILREVNRNWADQ
jgi:hypothetical protein